MWACVSSWSPPPWKTNNSEKSLKSQTRTFVPMSVCKCSRGFLFKILQPVLWICQCYSCLNAVWQNTAQLTRSWLKPEMFCMQWRPLCWFLSLLKVIPCCRRALKPMRKTWRYHLPSSAARTWCAACAWRWCLRRSTLASAALASSPTATTATVWSAFASGGVPSSLRAKSSSKCFSLLWTKWKWHCGCGVRVCRTSELVVSRLVRVDSSSLCKGFFRRFSPLPERSKHLYNLPRSLIHTSKDGSVRIFDSSQGSNRDELLHLLSYSQLTHPSVHSVKALWICSCRKWNAKIFIGKTMLIENIRFIADLSRKHQLFQCDTSRGLWLLTLLSGWSRLSEPTGWWFDPQLF